MIKFLIVSDGKSKIDSYFFPIQKKWKLQNQFQNVAVHSEVSENLFDKCDVVIRALINYINFIKIHGFRHLFIYDHLRDTAKIIKL